jgi:hypothetical protein
MITLFQFLSTDTIGLNVTKE